jgi:hypothetical protein
MVINNIRAKRLRIKLFRSSSISTVERDVNQWLSTTEATVTNMEVQTLGEKNDYTLLTITYIAE